MPIIIQKLLYNLSLASKLIINKLKDNNDVYSSTYEILSKLPNYKKLRYIFITCFIIYVMHFININLNHIFSLLIISIIIYFFINKDISEFNSYINIKDIELKFLNTILFDNSKDYTIGLRDSTIYNFNDKISYLYLNPLIVSLLYKIKEYSQYSFAIYKDILFHINNLLKIKININQISNNNLQLFEIAYTEYINVMNSCQSMIYSLPSSKESNIQFKNCLIIIDKILLNEIHEMKNHIINTDNNVDLNYIPENFFENFNIMPNQDIKSVANEVFNFYI